MAIITSANVAQAITKIIASEVLEALMPEFLMGNLVNRDYESSLASYGDTVNVPIPPTLVANNIIESGSVQPQAQSLGNAQIVLDTHAEATFQIPDVTKAIAQPDLVKAYMRPAVIAIAARVEGDLLNQYALFTSNAITGGASTLDESRIDTAETELFNAYVPDSEPKYLILSGATYGAARQLPRFSEYQTGINRDQESPIQTGRNAAQLKGFSVYRSQLVPKVGGINYNIAFARNALALVIRKLPMPLPGTGAIAEYAELGNFGVRVVMSYQPNTLAQQFTVDCLYGTGPLRQSFGVVVQTNN